MDHWINEAETSSCDPDHAAEMLVRADAVHERLNRVSAECSARLDGLKGIRAPKEREVLREIERRIAKLTNAEEPGDADVDAVEQALAGLSPALSPSR